MKVLLATDGSRFSEAAERVIMERLQSKDTEVCVLYAIEPPYLIPYYYVGTAADIEVAEAKGLHRGQQLTTRSEERLSKDGFTACSYVTNEDPRSAIVQYAEHWGADLIVMGSQGRTGLNRLLIGSVAEHVAQHAPCSVWIVRDPSLRSTKLKQNTTTHEEKFLEKQAEHEHRQDLWHALSNPPFYVTAPLLADDRELGFTALHGAVLADAIARHRRMCGFDVSYFSGASRSLPPESTKAEHTIDRERHEREIFETVLRDLSVAPDRHECSSSAHAHAVEVLLQRTMRRSLHAICKAPYIGRYCIHDNIDISASSLPTDCPVCGKPGQLISEDRYFFRLGSFKDRLVALYERHPAFIASSGDREKMQQELNEALPDICISTKPGARISWPGDSTQAIADVYANLAAYLSAIGFGEGTFAGPDFERLWPARLHVVSSDQLRNHAIYWPAFLMAADLPVPKHILAYPVCDKHELTRQMNDLRQIKRLAEQFGGDAIRYCLLRTSNACQGFDFDPDTFVQTYNSDLSSEVGTLARQIFSMIERHCDGQIPKPHLFPSLGEKSMLTAWDGRARVRWAFDRYDFPTGIAEIRSLIRIIHNLLHENDPSILAGDPSQKHRLANVLYDACEGLACVIQLLHPVLPDATDKVWHAFGQTTTLGRQSLDGAIWGTLLPGTQIRPLDVLFPQKDKDEVLRDIQPADPGSHDMVLSRKAG